MLAVQVDNGNIETGIRVLRRLLRADNIHAEVKRRNEFPNKTDRKKVKAVTAARRREKKREIVWAKLERKRKA